MTTYYLDSSALSKRYVQENGALWISSLVDPRAENTLLTARITMVEIFSALARRGRENPESTVECHIAAQAFTAHCATDYELIELDIKIVDLCHDLLDRHSLRAYDAVQLASAMIVDPVLQSAELRPLVFISADSRLNAIAEVEGLTVDNPNFHQ